MLVFGAASLSIASVNDPRSNIRAIRLGVGAVGAMILLAMWAMVIASIVTAREAAIDRTRSEGRNLAVAFADEVSHILGDVAGGMEIIAERMRAAHGQF